VMELPPIISDIPDQTIDVGGTFAAITLDDYADDPNNDDAELTWTHSGNVALQVIIVDRVATVTAPSSEWIGSETLTFTAIDPDGLSGSDAAVFTVHPVNSAPVLDAIADRTVDEGVQLTFTATATDIDIPADVLTYTLGAGAPAGASITTSGVFNWTPAEAQGPGVYPITVQVTDGALSNSATFTVTVNEVNVAPELDAVADKTVELGATLVFTVTATDVDIPANTLTFSLGAGAPEGASITTGGMFSWTAPSTEGTYDVTVQVFDDTLSDSQPFTIKVGEHYVIYLPLVTKGAR